MNPKRLFAQWSGLCLMILLTACQQTKLPERSIDVLFIAYDQGEINAFKQLEKELNKKQIHYNILALGRASEVFRDNEHVAPINLQQPDLLRNDRSHPLTAHELETMVQSLHPTIIYSGMASTSQAQLLNAFKKNGSYTIAFYDNFDPIANKEYVQPFLNTAQPPDEVHIPSMTTRSSFETLPLFEQSLLTVTGSPALEDWDDIYQQTNTDTIRQELNINPLQPVVVFAGGYDTTYETYFRIFIEATASMPSILFLVTYHPKTDGSLEKQIVNKLASSHVRVIEKKEQSTIALSKLALVLVVHKSSMATQALYKHKPVLYIAEPSFNNFITQQHLAFVASSPEQIKKKLLATIEKDSNRLSLDSIGVPAHPSATISRLLKKKLHQIKDGN